MIQKRTILLGVFIMCIGIHSSFAQSSTLAAGLNEVGNGTGSMSFSVGLVFYNSSESSTGSESRGVQHAYKIITLGRNDPDKVLVKAKVYPNPTEAFVNLVIEEDDLSGMSFQLFDLNGRLVTEQAILSAQTLIPMENLRGSVYMLRVISPNREVKSFKITKK